MPAAFARRTSSRASADDRWTMWIGASAAPAKASARWVATASASRVRETAWSRGRVSPGQAPRDTPASISTGSSQWT